MTVGDKVYKNVKAICKERGIKIGSLEKNIGVFTGRLSRGVITLNEAYEVSKILGITINDLIEIDYVSKFAKLHKEKEIAELERRLAELRGQ